MTACRLIRLLVVLCARVRILRGEMVGSIELVAAATIKACDSRVCVRERARVRACVMHDACMGNCMHQISFD